MIASPKSLLYLFLFLSGFVFSQEHHFTAHSMDLPSKECYNIYQDSKGFIWFSTVKGFCKYDGKSVVNYDRTKGLPENSVYSVSEDDKGRIWILTRSNRILYLENDVIHEPAFSKVFEKIPSFTLTNFAHHFQFSNNFSDLIVYSFTDTYVIHIETGEISCEPKSKRDAKIVELKYINGKIGQSAPIASGAREKIDVRIVDEKSNELLRVNDIAVDKSFLHRIIRTRGVGPVSYFSFANLLFQFNRKTNEIKQIELGGRIICIYSDKSGGIWVGAVGSGVYYFSDGDITKKPIHSLRYFSVSGITEDSEGGIWATTLKRGIFYSPNKRLVSYQSHEGLRMTASSLATFNNKVYIGAENLKLIEVDKFQIREIPLRKKISEFITDVVPYEQSIFIGNLFQTMQVDANWNNIKSSRSDQTISVFPTSRMHLFGGKLYASNNNYLFEFNRATDKFELLFEGPIKIRDFHQLDRDRWLLGDKSLIIFNSQTQKVEKLPGCDGVVSKILKLKNGTILISTVEAGLFKYANGKLTSLNARNQKLPLVLFDMAEDENGVIWIASNNGLIRYMVETNQIRRFGMQDGIISNDIQRLVICHGYLFLSTVEGVCCIPIESFNRSAIAPMIYYNGAAFSGKKMDLRSRPTVAYASNNLMIKSRIINYANRTVHLSYALILNKDTLNKETVDGTDLVLDNLAPGNYKLLLHAINEEGVKGNELVFHFKIQAPFWKTSWFIVLMLIGIALLMYVIINSFTSFIRMREERKTHLNELLFNSKLMALQSQMNPHFIFNAINSIQNFILKKDVHQAYDYLTKFSQLIRLVLQNSRSKETTLKEELKVLQLYISLEQLRFDNQFEFLVEVEDDLDIDSIYLPPMLIQPIIENSIWHGIMPLRGERLGKVNLRITVDIDVLIICVEDNGVGRVAIANDSVHESISMDVTQERLNILNVLQNDNRAKIEVVDLIDSEGNACGTKVILYIPLEREE